MMQWSEQDIPDLGHKRVLVTGAASGIGYEAARAMALHGAEVLMADRNVPAGHAAVEGIRALRTDARVRFLPLDLSRLQSVRDFGTALVAERGRLDVLVNNAGISPIANRLTSADGFELTFAIGHLGHYVLTGLLLPLLNAAPEPRVVTVSSLVHGKGWFDWDDLQMERGYEAQRAYNQTKLANLLFALEFQRRLTQAGGKIASIAVHPGVARTGIGASRRNLGKLGLRDHAVSVVLAFVMPFLGQDAAEGALPTLYGATSPGAQGGGFYGPDGFGEMKGAPQAAKVKGVAGDRQVASRLWEVTEKLTGLRYAGMRPRRR